MIEVGFSSELSELSEVSEAREASELTCSGEPVGAVFITSSPITGVVVQQDAVFVVEQHGCISRCSIQHLDQVKQTWDVEGIKYKPGKYCGLYGAVALSPNELVLVDVVVLVGHRQHFGLINVVDLGGFEDLGLDEVADARLRHDGDGHGLLDALDHLRVAHARDAAVRADVGGDALEGHDGDGAGGLGLRA